jgi:polyferredoxin
VRESLPYQLFADAILTFHVAIVVFVVGGLILILVGNFRGWLWVNTLWFRLAHLSAIATVVAEAWFGVTCPLTSFEMWLRTKAGATPYNSSFIEYWLQRALYYDFPLWVFTVAYSLFGLIVAITWWYFPPRSNRRNRKAPPPLP